MDMKGVDFIPYNTLYLYAVCLLKKMVVLSAIPQNVESDISIAEMIMFSSLVNVSTMLWG